jgi:hypothetical protein
MAALKLTTHAVAKVPQLHYLGPSVFFLFCLHIIKLKESSI